jgi:hypothetical protein
MNLKSLTAVVVLVVVLGLTSTASAQVIYYRTYSPVVTYSPIVTTYSPVYSYPGVVTYSAPVPVTTYSPVVEYPPVMTYRPVIAYSPAVPAYYGSAVVGAPYYGPYYVPGQPVRNVLRAITW